MAKEKFEVKCWVVLATRSNGKREFIANSLYESRQLAVEHAHALRGLRSILKAKAVRLIAKPALPL